MSDIYSKIFDTLTAPDQTFAFQEELHPSGITYREFTNIPKTLANFFEFGLMFPEWEFVVFEGERYTYQDIHNQAAQAANAVIESNILAKGSTIDIQDLAGDGNHYSATVTSSKFSGKSKIEQHKMVYNSLKGKMGNELHALAIKTKEQ